MATGKQTYPPLDLEPLLSAITFAAQAHKDPSEKSRRNLRAAALALAGALESPPEALSRTLFQPHRATAVRIAIEGKWLEAIAAHHHGSGISADELAKAVGAQTSLLVRIMRILIVEGIVAEPDVETYACNSITWIFIVPGPRDGCIQTYDCVSTTLGKLPLYLANTGYVEPQNDAVGPYAFTHGRTFWDHLEREPMKKAVFDSFMSAQKTGRGTGTGGWLDVFPVEEELMQQEPGAVNGVQGNALRAGEKEEPPLTRLGSDPQEVPLTEPHIEDSISTEIEGRIGAAEADASASSRTQDKSLQTKTEVLSKMTSATLGQPPVNDVEPPDDSSRSSEMRPVDRLDAAEDASAGGPSEANVVLVDIGGGIGHEVREFKRRYGNKIRGKAVLQDLPSTINTLDAASLNKDGIEVMAHNFFLEQPMKGARLYYIASVLHDWSDENCARILAATKPAMRVNYSSIIIIDVVVPERNVPYWTANLDLTVMAVCCGKERTRKDFEELVDKVGMRIRGVWMLEEGAEGCLEVVLKEDQRPVREVR